MRAKHVRTLILVLTTVAQSVVVFGQSERNNNSKSNEISDDSISASNNGTLVADFATAKFPELTFSKYQQIRTYQADKNETSAVSRDQGMLMVYTGVNRLLRVLSKPFPHECE